MSNYRDSVRAGAAPMTVLVADKLIDKGTSGDVIAEAELFAPTQIREDQVSAGAFTSPEALSGLQATKAIYPGQQLAPADFAPGADPVAGKLTGTQRALSIPVDAAHGNIGQIHAGSMVDVLGGFNAEQSGGRATPVVDVLARDVLVIDAPAGESGGAAGGDEAPVVLRLTDVEAGRVAFASDHGELWLTVRPPTVGKDSKESTIELDSLLGAGTIATQGG
jgi:Flp pilus assembly protein CpaB